MIFDGSMRSPSAPGHAHDSCGHFSFSALGEYFAIDTGRYNIEQDCHNVVLVDGRSGRDTQRQWVADYHQGRLTHYAPGQLVDHAAVDSSHQHNCCWAWRYIGLVKGAGLGAPAWMWTVDDINKDNDYASFWWQLHTSPENEITLRGDAATIRGWRQGNLLDVHFALPDPRDHDVAHTLEVTQDIAHCSALDYANPAEGETRFARPADMLHGPVFTRPRLLAKITGCNGRILSLMLPRRAGDPPATVEQLPTLDNALAVRVTFAEVCDTLIWAYDHQLLEADHIVGRGRWCLVRRARADGKVIAHATDADTHLEVDGELVR